MTIFLHVNFAQTYDSSELHLKIRDFFLSNKFAVKFEKPFWHFVYKPTKEFFPLLDILCVDIVALSVTYEYPVLCDIIDMHDLEKAAGSYHSCCGLVYLLFVPLSGMSTFHISITSLPHLASLLDSITSVKTSSPHIKHPP